MFLSKWDSLVFDVIFDLFNTKEEFDTIWMLLEPRRICNVIFPYLKVKYIEKCFPLIPRYKITWIVINHLRACMIFVAFVKKPDFDNWNKEKQIKVISPS